MGKYKSTIILTLALTVFLASCKGATTTPVTTPGPSPSTKKWVVSTFAGTANTAGATKVGINAPEGVAVDSSGNVYVASTADNSIQKITTSEAGVVTVNHFAGTGVATRTDGTPNADHATDAKLATFNGPKGVAVDSDGNVYVADTGSHTIRKIASTGRRAVSTLAGAVNVAGTTDHATGTTARFNGPQGLVVDSSGNLYVADTGNNLIRKITSAGAVSRFAGSSAGTAGQADGAGLSVATFDGPQGVAVVGDNLYVADTGNHCIRRIVISTQLVDTFAGTADATGHADGTGATATFETPSGVAAVDSSGNLYVVDTARHIIRKITSKGDVVTITTIAGFAEISGDENSAIHATLSMFESPQGVVALSDNVVYVADTANHTIRKLELK